MNGVLLVMVFIFGGVTVALVIMGSIIYNRQIQNEGKLETYNRDVRIGINRIEALERHVLLYKKKPEEDKLSDYRNSKGLFTNKRK